MFSLSVSFFFFFNDTATTEIYTLSLHDALPIWKIMQQWPQQGSRRISLRIAEDLPDLSSLHDLPTIQDQHLVANFSNDRHVVRDQHNRQTELAVDIP